MAMLEPAILPTVHLIIGIVKWCHIEPSPEIKKEMERWYLNTVNCPFTDSKLEVMILFKQMVWNEVIGKIVEVTYNLEELDKSTKWAEKRANSHNIGNKVKWHQNSKQSRL